MPPLRPLVRWPTDAMCVRGPVTIDRSRRQSSKKKKKLLLILLQFFPVFFFHLFLDWPPPGTSVQYTYTICKTTAVVKHLHTHAIFPCLSASGLVSSLHLCLCLIGPRSTLDQHRRLVSPPATRQHSPSAYATSQLKRVPRLPPCHLVSHAAVAACRHVSWEHQRYD
jgi:hypothetical protein